MLGVAEGEMWKVGSCCCCWGYGCVGSGDAPVCPRVGLSGEGASICRLNRGGEHLFRCGGCGELVRVYVNAVGVGWRVDRVLVGGMAVWGSVLHPFVPVMFCLGRVPPIVD